MSELIHLSKDVPGLLDAAFVRQYSADAVRRPDVLVVVPQDRLVHGQGPVLVFLLLLLVLRGLVEGLKPHIPQSNVTEKGKVQNPYLWVKSSPVSVTGSVGLLQNSLKLFLP